MNRFRVSQRFAQRCGVPRFATTSAASDADRAQSGVLQAVSRLGAVAGTVMLGGAIITIKWRSDQKKVDQEWRQRNGLPIDGVAPSLNEIPAEAQAAVDAIAEAFRTHATNANEQPKESPPVSEAHAAVAKIFEAAKQAPRTKNQARDGTEPLARRAEEPSSISHSAVAHDTKEPKHADSVATTATAPPEEHAPVTTQVEAKATGETTDTSTASVEVVEAVVVAVAGASDTTIVVVEAEKGNSAASSVVVVEDTPQLNLVFEIVSTPSNEASNAAVAPAEGRATADDIVTTDAPAPPASSEESSLAAIVAVMEEGVAPLVVMTTDESKDSTVVIVIEDAAATPPEQQLPVEPSAVVTPPSTNADATSAPSETHSHQ